MILKRWCSWISVTFLFAWTCLAGEPAHPTNADDVFARHAGEPDEQAGTDGAFQTGQKAIKESRWDKAIEAFDDAIRQKSSRTDGALYWKAYAQNRLGQRDGALQTLQSLSGSFPKSSWLSDAKALEIEIRGGMGQPVSPESQADEELKLMAINALISSDPERALPILQKTLQSNQSPKIKEKALFILAQSGSAPARDLLVQIARGTTYPELQSKALNYLALFGGKQSRQTLEEIYRSNSDIKVKRQILHGYMVGGDRDRLLALAKDEKVAELQQNAIHQLGVLGARAELWNLYQAGPGPDSKAAILQALFIGGDTDRLIELARTEKDPKLRSQLIHLLGVSNGQKTGDALLSIYQSESDASIRRKAVEGLFIQGNAKALVQLARKESNIEMKKELVSKLSLMKSKEALDYMMEILNK